MSKQPPSVEDAMFLAFRKLEERKEREKVDAQRAIELEKFKARQFAEERKKKIQDRLIYASLVLFLVAIGAIINKAKEKGYFDSGGNSSGQAVEDVDCSISENWKLPVCIELRQHQLDVKWQSMMFNKNGKERPFSVHGEKKSE